MLPKKNRMSTQAFEGVLKSGRPLRTDHLSARVLSAPEGEAASFSFVVPKKTLKGAVKRALLRRRGYHAIRDLIHGSDFSAQLILFARPGAEMLSFDTLKAEIRTILEKSGIL